MFKSSKNTHKKQEKAVKNICIHTFSNALRWAKAIKSLIAFASDDTAGSMFTATNFPDKDFEREGEKRQNLSNAILFLVWGDGEAGEAGERGVERKQGRERGGTCASESDFDKSEEENTN